MVENDLVDIVAAGCDAGIRYGSVPEQDMISIPIGPRRQQTALAAAPACLEARGMPGKPEDLTGHDAIRYRFGTGELMPLALRSAGRSVQVEPVNALILGVSALDRWLRYARAGLGIINTFRNWLQDDFQAESLVPVLPDWWPEMDGPHLYYPNRFAPTPLRAFIEVCRASAGKP